MRSLKSVVVGALAATIVFGGIQVVSAVTSNKEITACADKKTGVMRYTKKSCKKSETKLVFNTQGVPGAVGAIGATGATGLAGPAGSDGVNATLKISEQSVCGDDGASLCEVGARGPGGGRIFFIDYNDQYPNYDYLEAAPTDAGFADDAVKGAWSTSVANCGWNQGMSCVTETVYTETGPALAALKGSHRGVFGGITATARIIERHGETPKNQYAAGVADEYVSPLFRGATKSDWYLPSHRELELMRQNLNEAGLGNFVYDIYWSSSEHTPAMPWGQYFDIGFGLDAMKLNSLFVRPVRAF